MMDKRFLNAKMVMTMVTKEEEDFDTVVLGNCVLASENPPQTIEAEMQMMFLRLGLSQMVAQKIVKDQVIDFL